MHWTLKRNLTEIRLLLLLRASRFDYGVQDIAMFIVMDENIATFTFK